MNAAAKASDVRVDQFFTGAEARFDRWRSLLQAARVWEGAEGQQRPERERYQAAVSTSLAELRQWEDFLLTRVVRYSELSTSASPRVTLQEHLVWYSPSVLRFSRIPTATTPRIGKAKSSPRSISPERVPGAVPEETATHRPYFEVLVVSPARPAAWSELAQELRNLRRPQDKFIYEPVFVGSFEDAVLATILNGGLEAVLIYEGISFVSTHHSPVLREFLTSRLASTGIDAEFGDIRPGACQGAEAVSSRARHLLL